VVERVLGEPGVLATYREIVPTLLRQLKDPTHFVRRRLPPGAAPFAPAAAIAPAA